MNSLISSETKILKRIADNKQCLSNAIYFALDTAFPFLGHAFAQDILLGINIPRYKLGLDPQGKPGDIDYLIVPIKNGKRLYGKSIAIEAKIVRPTMKNPGKNANSIGSTQAQGLLNDGFPFVGLLHVSVPEPTPEEYCYDIPLVSNRIGADEELQPSGNLMRVDMFPIAHAARHEGRLINTGMSANIAYKVIALNLGKNGETFFGFTMNESRRGQPNPNASKQLTTKISELVDKEPDIFTTISWYEKSHS